MKKYLFIPISFLLSFFSANQIIAQTKHAYYGKDQEFIEFWLEFREAVIINDTMNLHNLIHFPLKVKGEHDEDSIIYFNANNFNAYFSKFLRNYTFYVDGKFISNIEYIRNTEIPEKATVFQETKIWKRVGDLEFENIKNKWRLTLIYCPQ